MNIPASDSHPPHSCPCGCGAQIPYQRLACRSGWYTLPQPLRHRITGGGIGRVAAVIEALNWFREHVRDGESLARTESSSDVGGVL
jgi:transglutaminase-like putative cysteine protease